jgi:citrate synthase
MLGYHPRMTDAPAASTEDTRPYSPGLAGVVAGETALCMIDGERGRLLYRGYRIGDIVEHGTYSAVANLLWTGEWDPTHQMMTGPLPPEVLTVLRALPPTTKPMDALRTAVSTWGAVSSLSWPPTVEEARALTSASPSMLAAFARIREGLDPVEPDPSLDIIAGFLYQLKGTRPDAGTVKALDAYFMVGAEHSFNASTFTARVIISTRSDLASAVAGAIGTMKGPLHGGAPSEVVDQLGKIGSPEHAEAWLNDALDRKERLMGFGHRVYRAYDPRAAALRKVAESMPNPPDWLQTAIAVEDTALRVLKERHPERALMTNVEYYAAPVLLGVGLTPDLFPATFSLARHAGWTAHALEQAAEDRLIRPDVRYIGPAERDLPG